MIVLSVIETLSLCSNLASGILRSMKLDPPQRLLCGPGPTNVEPSVLAAMGRPMLGHLDPAFHEILHDVVGMLRQVYRAPRGLVLPLHCTGMAGVGAGHAHHLQPRATPRLPP